MYFITGDTHRDFDRIEELLYYTESDDDVLIILGDVGINYQGYAADYALKQELSELPITLFCIYGNHEMRPENINTYETKEWNNGIVYWEPEFPNLLFAKDGEIYELDGLRCVVIGGANSIDKHLRVRGVSWWEDEQPSPEIMAYVEEQLEAENWKVDVVLSHTCPYSCMPKGALIKFPEEIKHMVDSTTEKWLDKIESKLSFSRWYCGHFHTDEIVNNIHFLYQGFEEL
ncbi:MAG: metallophosphoesterase [Oscillospiraceae bacterium]|jgi:3-oxoacid CoA-transferase subunit A|nr:metallophosphoesterase [Oscillospiraceae bacterium]